MLGDTHSRKSFFLLIACLFAAGVAVGATRSIEVPEGWRPTATILSTILFLALPIFALFFGSAWNWTWRSSAVALFASVGVFAGLTALSRGGAATGWAAYFLAAALQVGVLAWAGSLGALLATTVVREKGLLLPVAFALATVDIVAVFAPVGTVKQALQTDQGRAAFEAIAYTIPQIGSVEPLARVGPADFLFLAMFFVAIHRFGMRSRETLYAIVPGLIFYLMIVLFFGDAAVYGISLSALPALVPMGLLVIAVNWREFQLTKQEKAMTLVFGALCATIIGATFFAASKSSERTPVPSPKAQQG